MLFTYTFPRVVVYFYCFTLIVYCQCYIFVLLFTSVVVFFYCFYSYCWLLVFVCLLSRKKIPNTLKGLWLLVRFLKVESFQEKVWWDLPLSFGDENAVKYAHMIG